MSTNKDPESPERLSARVDYYTKALDQNFGTLVVYFDKDKDRAEDAFEVMRTLGKIRSVTFKKLGRAGFEATLRRS